MADFEMRMEVQVVYLEGDSRKSWQGEPGHETGEGRRAILETVTGGGN